MKREQSGSNTRNVKGSTQTECTHVRDTFPATMASLRRSHHDRMEHPSFTIKSRYLSGSATAHSPLGMKMDDSGDIFTCFARSAAIVTSSSSSASFRASFFGPTTWGEERRRKKDHESCAHVIKSYSCCCPQPCCPTGSGAAQCVQRIGQYRFYRRLSNVRLTYYIQMSHEWYF